MTSFQTIFFPPQHTPSTGCTDCTVSKVLYILILIGPKGTHRLYSAVCTVLYSLYILKLIGHKGTYRLYNVYSLKLIGNKWTNSIVSDLVNILKVKGPSGLYSVYSFVQFVLWSISCRSISGSHIQNTDFKRFKNISIRN